MGWPVLSIVPVSKRFLKERTLDKWATTSTEEDKDNASSHSQLAKEPGEMAEESKPLSGEGNCHESLMKTGEMRESRVFDGSGEGTMDVISANEEARTGNKAESEVAAATEEQVLAIRDTPWHFL